MTERVFKQILLISSASHFLGKVFTVKAAKSKLIYSVECERLRNEMCLSEGMEKKKKERKGVGERDAQRKIHRKKNKKRKKDEFQNPQ